MYDLIQYIEIIVKLIVITIIILLPCFIKIIQQGSVLIKKKIIINKFKNIELIII